MAKPTYTLNAHLAALDELMYDGYRHMSGAAGLLQASFPTLEKYQAEAIIDYWLEVRASRLADTWNLVIDTAPAISGTVILDAVLTTTNGTWTGDTPTAYTYQWYKKTLESATTWAIITNATAITYAPTTGDLSRYIRVGVIAQVGNDLDDYSDVAFSDQTTGVGPAA